jgi:uncharacterized protein (TIGR00369 family)
MDNQPEEHPYPVGVREVTEGPWAGWRTYGARDPFEDLAGPFYRRTETDGAVRCAFRAERRHLNVAGLVHGGCLMTFADFALFEFALAHLERAPVVTAAFNSELVGPAREGDLVEAAGEVVKGGRSLVFVRGLARVGAVPVMSFSGVLKKLKTTEG